MLLKAIFKPFIWIYLGLVVVLRTSFLVLVNFCKYVVFGLITVIKTIIDVIKYILKNFMTIILSLFKYVGLGLVEVGSAIVFVVVNLAKLIGYFVRYVGLGAFYSIKYLGIFIYKLIYYIYQGFIVIAIITSRIVFFIPINAWRGIKAITTKRERKPKKKPIITVEYKTAPAAIAIPKEPVKQVKENAKPTLRDKSSRAYMNFIASLKNFPKLIKDNINKWVSSLQFVRHIRNKREMQKQALLIDFNSKEAARSDKKLIYQYTAKNPDGKLIKGVFAAYSKVDVHSFLISEGYEVYDIKNNKTIDFLYGGTLTVGKMKPKQLIFFLTQLSTYIRAGIALTDSIRILSKQDKRPSVQRMFQGIIYELTMGESFSEALNKQGNVFPKLLINMIKTSEMTGELPEALDDMAEYYTTVERSRKQTVSALAYPSVILVLSFIVLAFIMVWVVPQFVDIYKQANAPIPDITKATIAISTFLQSYAWLLAIVIIGVVALLVTMYKKVKLFKTIIQWLLMHVPVVGKIMIYNEITMFSKTFGSLLKHNVFITDSMEILSKITDNEIYKMLVFDTISNLARGESISSSFKNHWAVPIIAYEMMVTGERTGQLPVMMEKVAGYFQEQQKTTSTQLKAFLEPAVIVFLAITVGIILMSVIIPMFSLYGNISAQ